jgi:ubiquitin carboxyl-terminal hydrolase 14
VYDFCSESLQAVLRGNREKKDKLTDELVSKKLKGDASHSEATAEPMDLVSKEETMAAPESSLSKFASGLPDDFTGMYELVGVVTHKGRSADSGHYIGWVRQEGNAEYWWKYDDEKVSEVKTQEILDLRGGGDWHTAYLNIYRFKSE